MGNVNKKHHPSFTKNQLQTIFTLCLREINTPTLTLPPNQRNELQEIMFRCSNVIRRKEQ